MKKYLILFFLLILPINVFASSKRIENYNVYVNIDKFGNAEVSELITVNFNNHNTDIYNHQISYKDLWVKSQVPTNLYSDGIYNATSLTEPKVFIKYLGHDEEASFDSEFINLSKVYYKEDLSVNNYLQRSTDLGKDISINIDKNYNRVAFLFKYILSNIVVSHMDSDEIYYPFLRNNIEDNIDKFELNINLPFSNISRFYTHGSKGKYKINGSLISYVTTNHNSYSEIRFRLLLDKGSFESITKESNVFARDAIIRIENEREETITIEEQNKVFNTNLVMYVSIIYLAIVFILFFITLWFSDRDNKNVKVPMDYHFNYPALDYFSHNMITKRSFISSLLRMILDKDILCVRKGKDYILTINKSPDYLSCEVLEDYLIDSSIKKNISFNELIKFIKQKKHNYYYDNYLHVASKEALKEKFYVSNGIPVVFSIFLFLISFFIVVAGFYFKVYHILPYLTIIVSSINFIYALTIKKKTMKGIYLTRKEEKLKERLANKEKFIDDESLLVSIIYDQFDETLKRFEGNIDLVMIKDIYSALNKSLPY